MKMIEENCENELGQKVQIGVVPQISLLFDKKITYSETKIQEKSAKCTKNVFCQAMKHNLTNYYKRDINVSTTF